MSDAAPALLEITGLDISFDQGEEKARALRGLDLAVLAGTVHALVGESGSGKTVTSRAIMGLVPIPPASINGGSIRWKGTEILGMEGRDIRKLRGKEISMVFQEPSKYLNPSMRMGTQITEMLTLHLGMDKGEAETRALDLVRSVGLRNPERVLRSYPHELSGGMKQRAMIAMAISCKPGLLIADEPTTALDVTLQLQILKLLLSLKERLAMTVLFISHDLSVVHEIADTISVIYAGRIVEQASRSAIFAGSLHPYTRLLILSIPE
ncbi:MAG: ABC transporter ATP-binding protein, partial [Spirochaetota bacterium]